MENFKVVEVFGKSHVLVKSNRTGKYTDGGGTIPAPNYNHTGMALCGILKEGEGLNDFIGRTS